MIPEVSGRSKLQKFAGHPGWIDIYKKGYGPSTSTRINSDGTFNIAKPDDAVTLIATFDKMETPPVIVPRWPQQEGEYDIHIPVEYACIPDDYPQTWDRDYKTRAYNYWQTFVPQCTQIYGVTVFDGPKIVEWGNKINVGVHHEQSGGPPVILNNEETGQWSPTSAGHSDHEFPRVGWRHGDLAVEPGKPYALRVGGYRSHGGKHFQLDAFIRPDRGDGYALGNALADERDMKGDLCCMVFGNRHGQIVENHIRTEEWEIFIPQHRPGINWGQQFVAHGVSLAGIVFWGSNGNSDRMFCEVRIREEGPGGKLLKPVKLAASHDSPVRPIIRYPETPEPLPEYKEYYKLPCDLFHVAYQPNELRLEAEKTYYVEVVAFTPIMMYADGDYYRSGYAFYEGLKVEKIHYGHATLHSNRWTLAMTIITYANSEGGFLQPEK